MHDPFIVGSGYVLPDNYGEVLNIGGDGVMGYVEIPKADIYLPIYHGTDEETLQNGAGHLEVTALPIGGKNRHPVISAHRGLPSAELFTRLDEMETGDLFFLHILDRTLAYQVDRISVILPEELSLLTPEEDKDLVTLLTCTPYAVNTHRLLVRGSRIPWEAGKEAEETADAEGAEGAEREESENAGGWQAEYLRAAAAGLLLLLLLAAAVWAVRRRRKKRGK